MMLPRKVRVFWARPCQPIEHRSQNFEPPAPVTFHPQPNCQASYRSPPLEAKTRGISFRRRRKAFGTAPCLSSRHWPRHRIKYVEAVSKTKGRVGRWSDDRSLAVLWAVGVSQIKPSRKFLVLFVISESPTRAKLTCCWQPCQRSTRGKTPAESNGGHGQIAEIVSDQPPVLKLRKQVPFGKDTL